MGAFMSVKSRYMRLCDEMANILSMVGENDYIEHFQKEKKSVEDGKFNPEWEDLFCLSVLCKQLKKENAEKIIKIKS